jgi:predicted adenine nucleotide alpha hydrolase (AANH) superfamily ATPase
MIKLRVLVHVCCAPCFTSVHQSLKDSGHEVVGYFYNPNIHPYQEFLKRLHCVERYTALKPVEMIYNKEYDLDKYLVGALHAKYDPPEDLQAYPKPRKKNGGFQEKVEMKESLQIKLTPKGGPKAGASTSTINIDGLNSQSSNKKDIHRSSDFNPRCGYCINLRLAKTAKYAAENGFDAFTTTLLESKYQPHEYIRKIGSELAKLHGIEFFYKDFRAGWKESIRLSKKLQLYRQPYCGCIFSEYERFGPEGN